MGTGYRGDLVAFGEFVRQRRRSLGLAQTQLGARLGLAQERVSTLENGKYGLPSLPQIHRLADALMVSFDILVEKVGIGGTVPSGAREHAAGIVGRTRLTDQLILAFEQLQEAEKNLAATRSQMKIAEDLTASLRARRQEIAALLAGGSSV
jgi:transcriptional regulator with XRE-family HTH domain